MGKKALAPEARRRLVARFLLARATQQEIADFLHVSQATVAADVQAIRARWRDEGAPDARDWIAEECRVLDADEAFWRAQLTRTAPADPALALRIYDRVAAIGGRRTRLKSLIAPPRDQTGIAALDAALAELEVEWEAQRVAAATAAASPAAPGSSAPHAGTS